MRKGARSIGVNRNGIVHNSFQIAWLKLGYLPLAWLPFPVLPLSTLATQARNRHSSYRKKRVRE